MEKRESFEDAQKQIKKEGRRAAKPLTGKEKQIRSGKLTEEQAVALRQRYMDSLEYNEDQQFVTCCGGIQPLPDLPPQIIRETDGNKQAAEGFCIPQRQFFRRLRHQKDAVLPLLPHGKSAAKEVGVHPILA